MHATEAEAFELALRVVDAVDQRWRVVDQLGGARSSLAKTPGRRRTVIPGVLSEIRQ
jgi:hypothetical protein